MNIHYEITGSGKNTLVFLHGWSANKDLMQPLVSLFSKQYQCVNLDLFGFGLTDEIEDYESFDDYVEYFHLFLMEHQIEDPILVAHSFGARLAILYANRYPVSALILTGAAGIKSKLTIKKRIKQYLHKHHFKMKGSYDYEHATPFLRKVLVEVVNKDLSEQIKRIKVPTLLIWGEKDKETPLWMAKRMNHLISNSILIIFKKEDHFAYYHESNRFCFIVKEFLEGYEL